MSENLQNEISDLPYALGPGQLARIACLLEVTARKPGNVHRERDFNDLHFLDFLLSASVIGGPLDRAEAEGVGAAVLAAVHATRAVVTTNTNLGMILLLAPLAAVPMPISLREGIEQVLAATTVDDARRVYQAIRLAQPGGLGRVPDQDMGDEPTINLRSAMALAADRDLVARQYAFGYSQVLGEGLPTLRAALERGNPLESAIVTVFLSLLASHPDSLIVRKHGLDRAVEVSRRAGEVLASGWPAGIESRRICRRFDGWLRAHGHRFNPGTTADLVTATLFAGLRERVIRLPREPGALGWSDL